METSESPTAGQQRSRRLALLVALGVALVVLLCVASSGLLPIRAQVVVIGDSLSTGFGTSASDAWPVLVERDEEHGGNLEVLNAAENGSGYVAHGENDSTFLTEVERFVGADASIVLFFGSDNDLGTAPTEITDSAVLAFETAKAKAPEARIVVVGPPSYSPTPAPDLAAVRDALHKAAGTAGVSFVDPIADGWIAGDVRDLIGPDGEHPTAQGHVRLAQLMENVIRG